ncbi:MAG: N-acetylmuramoyl-L-alanine amidase [Clostridium sp.]|uniref:N-acetylmuramoyl-L-alanine amidase n=1 Tax=Clostridium sp. TaxID=1506 RepID=UPI002900887C|nr:N-acetylmuramoyl-L-alanine amidase [Clostridium sp.]MDU1585381.1 N-acetylmuramoyl-L-alanine amidase [Clostridium sp.]MDU1978483.1 N-acetylmuramoyl-L-alanine amidase [Clostridium sp.]MDU1994719.1 N-acetylmuramoyl-L-alanine amidase [Clostridium sp.]MDU6048378.1 N-acetylmuramoyl-L-alanine amidase [Clostridium sp.]MDU6222436.1 N-acetylmuramoyl-L-alanine amidase [Clostridium sp.]
MAVYGVNDGHTKTGPGSGAVGKIKESEHTRLVGNEVRRLLKDQGEGVINCTIDYANSTSESLDLIVKQANRQDLDWFIAIHFNAGGGKGVEVYTYEGRQYQDAIDVCKNIEKLGFRNRGVKAGTGLYVIRKTKAKAMLVEVCFVDTDDADKYLEVGYKAIAKAIVEGVLGREITTNKPTQEKPQIKEEGKLLKVMKNKVVRSGSKGDHVKMLQSSLTMLGYNVNGIDGHCGPGCVNAIKSYQRDNGLSVDGSCGPATWTSILTK